MTLNSTGMSHHDQPQGGACPGRCRAPIEANVNHHSRSRAVANSRYALMLSDQPDRPSPLLDLDRMPPMPDASSEVVTTCEVALSVARLSIAHRCTQVNMNRPGESGEHHLRKPRSGSTGLLSPSCRVRAGSRTVLWVDRSGRTAWLGLAEPGVILRSLP